MEKKPQLVSASVMAPPTKKRMVQQLAAIVAFFLAINILSPSTGTWLPSMKGSSDHAITNDKAFSWDALETKPYLDYTDCYGDFQCARLELPMDYFNGTTNATISLAVIRQPAVVPVTHPQYGGAVLLNPGGPGGSGVGFLFRGGKKVRETIDSVDGKYFDLISFDPRAVGETKPAVQCVKNLQLDHSWQVRVMEEGVFESSDAALGRLWSMAIARGQSCSLPHEDGDADMRKYVTTASVATDMLEIAEKHGEWRHKEAKRLLSLENGAPCGKSRLTKFVSPEVQVPESLSYKPSGEMLQYWGFSYGTYLGNTFAAMYPDRVGRVVVDGVVDAYNYKETLWSDNLLDTEKDMNQLYYHCARVGYPACALANEGGETTAEDVSQRVANISNSLYHNPLPVIGPNPEVISYSDIKNLIFAGLYTPVQSFPYIANLLASVERGDGKDFAKLLRAYHDFSCPARPGAGYSIIPLRNVTKGSGSMSYDATMAIACSDGDDQSYVNRTAFDAYVKELAAVSPSIGSMWSTIRLHCVHYNVRPVHRFEGPWVAKTSHPLLMIGNTADPVTPVKHAHNMAKGFEGAVALTQDSAGHCSSSTFSNCTVQYIRQYFQTGELPPANTVCSADEMPFGSGPEAEVASVELMEMRERHAGIGRALHEAGGGFMKLNLGGRVRDGWFE